MKHELARGLGTLNVGATLRLTRTGATFVQGGFDIVLRHAMHRLGNRSYVSLRRTPPTGRRVIYDHDFNRQVASGSTVRRTIIRCTRQTTRGLHKRHRCYQRIAAFMQASPFTMGRPYCDGTTIRGLPLPARSDQSVVTTTYETLGRI